MQQGSSRAAGVLLALGFVAAALQVEPSAVAQDAAPTTAQLMEQGEQLLAQGQHRRAIAAFEEANRLSGTGCAECFLGQSRAYVASNKADRGVAMARLALQLNPPKPVLARGYHQLAVALLAQPGRGGDAVNEAVGAFRKVIELLPGDSGPARFNLAALLFQSNQADEAVLLAREYLREYLKTAPTGGAVTEARMLVCLARKAPPAAEPATEAGAEVEPPRPLYRHPPSSSERARKDKLQGSVLVHVNIDREGCAAGPTISGGMGNELDNAAMEAVKRWVFQPATSQGKPVASDSIVSVNFSRDADPVKDPDKFYRERLYANWPQPQ